MSRAERLEAMERLWQSLSREDADDLSPDWHGVALDERAKLMESGKAAWLSLDELQTRLTKQ